MSNTDIKITKRQEAFDIETMVEIQGKEKHITGPMTFCGSKKAPNGSFALKVTSSMLNDSEADRAILREAFMDTFDECCDRLFDNVDQRKREAAGEDIEAGTGQVNLLDQIDEMKTAARGEADTGVMLIQAGPTTSPHKVNR